MRGIDWYVSLADVVKHPDYDKGATLEEILFKLGLDVSKGYYDDERWERSESHKSIAGDIVTCPRYVGKARTDGEWLRFLNHFLNLPVEFSKRYA